MGSVGWDTFGRLPGAATYNFEMLCRHLMHRHYGAGGDFKATANQAGIEFHLRLDQDCALGEAGRWFGWQCRWYELPPGRAIGTTRRDKIEKAVKDTVRDLPDLTDWVLWTRHPLTKKDQDWFYELKPLAGNMRLTLWTSANVEEHLAGPGQLYRETYFGELVLTRETLRELHARAVAPVRFRWLPEAHQPINAERSIQRMLGDRGARTQLSAAASTLEIPGAGLAAGLPADVPAALRDETEAFVATLAASRDQCLAVAADLERADWQALRSRYANTPRVSTQHRVLLRKLRNARSAVALPATNALDDLNNAHALIMAIEDHLDVRLVAVVADAGNGKTHLAAQLTADGGDRPAGIFLHGRQLGTRDTLDDLAQTLSIGGRACPTMEALLAALDAAGERAQRRLPLVIDGLNEAEDPRGWKYLLGAVEPLLAHYPHVLLVVTLRRRFVDECLPTGTRQLTIDGFGSDRQPALDRYFAHYRIDTTDADLPEQVVDNPLTLRLFCEVTNPDRREVVGLEAMPGSLTAVFDRYLDQAADRIAQLAPAHRRVYAADVHAALAKIGSLLWDRRAHGIEFERLRQLVDQDPHWDTSMVGLLEQEGILLRTPIRARPGKFGMIISFDALAGHIIADSLITARNRPAIEQWLGDPATVDALTTGHDAAHPLAEDIVAALAGLLPRRRHQQLWTLVPQPLRSRALPLTTALEARYLDAATVDALGDLLRDPGADHSRLFTSWQLLRGALSHPLNATFLHDTLSGMELAHRDLVWTEWTRSRWQDLAKDLRDLQQRWSTAETTDQRDHLRARWVMWLLTSTQRTLREQATRTLYWFGRRCPDELFALTLEALEINDRYVGQGTVAAAYGVVLAHQRNATDLTALPELLTGLRDTLLGPAATRPTDDWLIRLYVRGIIQFAHQFRPDALPAGIPTPDDAVFGLPATAEPLPAGDPRSDEVSAVLQPDFENYTIGSLLEDRANYDRDHPRYVQLLADIRGIIWALGWREATFGPIDEQVQNATYAARSRGTGNTERYGKKYSWIGFYATAGRMEAGRERSPDQERISDLPVDPSFPDRLALLPATVPDWARTSPPRVEDWVVDGAVDLAPELVEAPRLGEHEGPWIAVGGHLETSAQASGRSVWGMLFALLATEADADAITEAVTEADYPGRHWFPEPPQDYYTFAGEVPWHPDFARNAHEVWPGNPYGRSMNIGGTEVEVEVLAHRITWQGYDPSETGIGTVLVPSKSLSQAMRLRAGPQAFHQFDQAGAPASLSYGPPPRMTGHLLYLRRDVLQQYARGRHLVLLWWGERHPRPFPSRRPPWIAQAWKANKQVWREVRHLDLS
ncbi:hypothetical protein M8C17_01460 [Micromonospora sp. RHAY321]|uniref:hypothetical protein n=1 Tax=Micromonospora sp. RHAY321 TaxID=2944807 RepID=UPI00207CD38B|nr:hypothetical protein [Micromonospora sp. RHAY321]MCO1593828.1 hypothetical protein [Micromonospora sp. RHAY321]